MKDTRRHIGRCKEKTLCRALLKRVVESKGMHTTHTMNAKEKKLYYHHIHDSGIFLPFSSALRKLLQGNLSVVLGCEMVITGLR